MKPLRSLVLVLLLSGLFSSARALLVHFSFSDFDGSFLWRANVGGVSWNQNQGNIYQFDLYYDLATATGSSDTPGISNFRFSDPSRNFWQFNVTGPEHPVVYTISAPLENLKYDQAYGFMDTLSFEYWSPDPYGELEFTAFFQGPPIEDGKLPLPPLTSVSANIYKISGGDDWFPYPQMAEGYGYGDLLSGSAAIEPYVGFRAVPEPATYGLGGLAVLGLVMLRRLRRKPSPISGT